jgi:TPR repeat protein
MKTRVPTAEDDRLTRVRDGAADNGPSELPPELECLYEATGLLGAGAMGLVLKAHERASGRKVAIKLLKRPDSKAALDRFRREAELVSKIKHRHIVEIYKTGTADDIPYIVMELVEGGTLRDRLASGCLNWEDAVDITRQLLEGLQACHEFGVVHRDVKPENILMTAGGWVKISDLGVAKDYSSCTEGLTRAGELIGTPQYMAPEVLKGATAGANADLYSAGVVLYEMITNELPFGKVGLYKLYTAHQTQLPRPLSELAPELPLPLQECIMTCLAHRPADRPASAHDLAVWLGRCVGRVAHSAVGSAQQSTKQERRPVVLPFLIVLVLLVGVLVFIVQYQAEPVRVVVTPASPVPVIATAVPPIESRPPAPVASESPDDFDVGPEPITAQVRNPVGGTVLEVGDRLREQGRYEAAMAVFQRRARRGDPGACYRLGLMAQLGQGTPTNPVAAANWYRKAAECGVPEAQNNLAEMLRFGHGVPRNVSAALRLYLRAAAAGLVVAKENVDAICASGDWEKRPGARLVIRYRENAQRGDAWSNTFMGFLAQYGRGMPADRSLALVYFRAAAARQEPVAEWHLEKLGEPPPDGTRWIRLAAEHGSGDAANALGEQLATDPARAREAVNWWTRAANAGHCTAQRHLAQAYRTGAGVTPDPGLADLFTRMAALGGDAEAQRMQNEAGAVR